MKLLTTLVAGFLLLSSPAMAQSPNECTTHDDVIAQVSELSDPGSTVISFVFDDEQGVGLFLDALTQIDKDPQIDDVVDSDRIETYFFLHEDEAEYIFYKNDCVTEIQRSDSSVFLALLEFINKN